MYGAIHLSRVAGLEIGTAAAIDHQAITAEQHARLAREVIREVGVGMAWHVQAREFEFTPAEGGVHIELDVAAGEFVQRRAGDLAATELFEFACAGQVVGVDMGLECGVQAQAQLLDEFEVP